MQYKNAPIQEAVFDVRVTTVLNQDLSTFETIGKKYFKDYPKEEKRVRIGGQINITSTSQNVTTTPTVLGSMFSNEKGNRKIQIRKDGYTFNMLKPYSSWAEFFDLAIMYWEVYEKHISPVSISRIALRYVNRIELPTRDLDFDRYLKYVPKIPEGFPQTFNRFFLQMQIPCDDDGITANITQTFEPVVGNILPFLLDIDVFKMIPLNTDPRLYDNFGKMRHTKNKIFESFITDETRALFN